MKTEYNSLQDSIVKYPALKKTVALANKLGYKLMGHCAQFNKNGSVNSHWFRTKEDWERNQRILSYLQYFDAVSKNKQP